MVDVLARALATFASRKLLASLVGQPDAFGAGASPLHCFAQSNHEP
ncbi:MAG: hypothetical protein K6F50_05340 [Kiritimatiellae bacterium]|nr:hypothetical protein [Kiritimatiellia bacterium]